ncbi:hypothetical protein BRC2024_PQPTKSFJ_CDS_0007 [Tegunavirus sp. BRC001]
MSLTLTQEQVDFLAISIGNARSLMDAVHAYDSEEYHALGVANNILDGFSVQEAKEVYKEQYDD